MTAYTVLRFAKLKSWGAVGDAGLHNARLRQTTNADPEALTGERFSIGSLDDDLTPPFTMTSPRAGRHARMPFRPWKEV